MAHVFCGVKLYSVQMTFSLKLKAVWVVTKYGCQKSGYFMHDPKCLQMFCELLGCRYIDINQK